MPRTRRTKKTSALPAQLAPVDIKSESKSEATVTPENDRNYEKFKAALFSKDVIENIKKENKQILSDLLGSLSKKTALGKQASASISSSGANSKVSPKGPDSTLNNERTHNILVKNTNLLQRILDTAKETKEIFKESFKKAASDELKRIEAERAADVKEGKKSKDREGKSKLDKVGEFLLGQAGYQPLKAAGGMALGAAGLAGYGAYKIGRGAVAGFRGVPYGMPQKEKYTRAGVDTEIAADPSKFGKEAEYADLAAKAAAAQAGTAGGEGKGGAGEGGLGLSDIILGEILGKTIGKGAKRVWGAGKNLAKGAWTGTKNFAKGVFGKGPTWSESAKRWRGADGKFTKDPGFATKAGQALRSGATSALEFVKKPNLAARTGQALKAGGANVLEKGAGLIKQAPSLIGKAGEAIKDAKAVTTMGGLVKGGASLAKGVAGGATALLGGLALDWGTGKLRESGHEKLGAGTDIASSALTGAGIGGTVGSFVPFIGTAIGAAAGGAIGGAYGLYKNWGDLTGKGTSAEYATTSKEIEEKAFNELKNNPEKYIVGNGYYNTSRAVDATDAPDKTEADLARKRDAASDLNLFLKGHPALQKAVAADKAAGSGIKNQKKIIESLSFKDLMDGTVDGFQVDKPLSKEEVGSIAMMKEVGTKLSPETEKAYELAKKPKEEPKPQKTTERTSSRESESYTKIAGERFIPGQPLTKNQMAMIDHKRSMGNEIPPDQQAAYDLAKKQGPRESVPESKPAPSKPAVEAKPAPSKPAVEAKPAEEKPGILSSVKNFFGFGPSKEKAAEPSKGTRTERTSSREAESYTKIAGERFIPGQPLTKTQMAMIDHKRSMGNDIPADQQAAYDLAKTKGPRESVPEPTKTSSKPTAESKPAEEKPGMMSRIKDFFGFGEKAAEPKAAEPKAAEPSKAAAPVGAAAAGAIGGATAPKGSGNDEYLGGLSAKYEGNISSVSLDTNKKYAYGKYQFNEAGGLQDLIKGSPELQKALGGAQPGTPEFAAKWKKFAEENPEAMTRIQDVGAKKQYYDPVSSKAEKAGFKTDNKAIKEAIFSGSVQHGTGGVDAIMKRAAATPGFKDMTPEQQIQAFYAARRTFVSNIDEKKLNAAQKQQQYARYDKEEKDALARASGKEGTTEVAAAKGKGPGQVAAAAVGTAGDTVSPMPSAKSAMPGPMAAQGASPEIATKESEALQTEMALQTGRGSPVYTPPFAPAPSSGLGEVLNKETVAMSSAKEEMAAPGPAMNVVNNNVMGGRGGGSQAPALAPATPRAPSPLDRYQDRVAAFVT